MGFVYPIISTINSMYSQGDGIRASLTKCRAYPGYRRMSRSLDTEPILLRFALNGKGLTWIDLLKYSLINHARTKDWPKNRPSDSIAHEREVSAKISYSLPTFLSFNSYYIYTSSSHWPLFFRLLTRFSCLINV